MGYRSRLVFCVKGWVYNGRGLETGAGLVNLMSWTTEDSAMELIWLAVIASAPIGLIIAQAARARAMVQATAAKPSKSIGR